MNFFELLFSFLNSLLKRDENAKEELAKKLGVSEEEASQAVDEFYSAWKASRYLYESYFQNAPVKYTASTELHKGEAVSDYVLASLEGFDKIAFWNDDSIENREDHELATAAVERLAGLDPFAKGANWLGEMGRAGKVAGDLAKGVSSLSAKAASDRGLFFGGAWSEKNPIRLLLVKPVNTTFAIRYALVDDRWLDQLRGLSYDPLRVVTVRWDFAQAIFLGLLSLGRIKNQAGQTYSDWLSVFYGDENVIKSKAFGNASLFESGKEAFLEVADRGVLNSLRGRGALFLENSAKRAKSGFKDFWRGLWEK